MSNEKICDNYAKIAKRVLCWIFADIFNQKFGESTVVLVGADSDGKDVIFSATTDWLYLNHVNQFGTTEEMVVTEVLIHIMGCNSPQCMEVIEIARKLGPIFEKGFPIGVVLLSTMRGKSFETKTFLTSEDNFADEIKTLLPIFQLFSGENKDFWIWPEEEKAGEPEKEKT